MMLNRSAALTTTRTSTRTSHLIDAAADDGRSRPERLVGVCLRRVAPLGLLIVLQIAQEPVACQICYLVERARLLEQVCGARHNLQARFALQLPTRVLVHVDHRQVPPTDD